MKDNKDHIDDIFKESSGQQSFDIPESFLEDINKKLDALEKKKRRRGLWWLLLIPALVVGGFFLWPDHNEGVNLQISKTQRTNETKKSDENKDQKMNSGIDSIGIYEANESFEPTANGQEEQLNVELSPPVATRANRGSNTTPSKGDKEATEKTDNHSELLNARNEQEASSNTIQKENIESTTSERNTDEDVQNKENAESISTNLDDVSTDVDEVSTSAEDVSIDVDEVSTNANEVSTISDSENTTITEPMDEPYLSQNDTVLEGDETNQTLESDTIAKETKEKDSTSADSTLEVDSTKALPVKKNSNESSHEIQVFGSLMTSYSQVSLAGSASEISTAGMGNPLQVIPQFGLGYNYNFNNYSLGTGLLYQQSGESVHYETNTIEVQDSVYISGYDYPVVFNPNTQTWDTIQVPIYDTIGVNILIEQSYSGKNRFNWISIPLHFGYRMHAGNFTFIPRVGTNFDFGIGKNNGIYAELIDQGLIEHQANRFVLSYSLQFEIRRDFKRFHIFVNPYFKSNITRVISSVVQIRKYNSWGLNAGIGISF